MRRIVLVLLVLLLVAAGCGDDGSTVTEPTTPEDGGVVLSDVLPPGDDTVIETAAWGAVFDRRIVVRLADDAGPDAADRVAEAVGGTVVARIEDSPIAEIELAVSGEEALAAAMDTLAGNGDVAIVAPSEVVEADWDVVDRPCGRLDDLVLQQGNRSDQYRLTGVEDAWRLIKATGVTTTPPIVGVVDGFGPSVGYHGSWVHEVVDASPGGPPGVLDAILGDGAFTTTSVDVFGSSKKTSNAAWMAAVTQLVGPPEGATVGPPVGATVVNLSLGGKQTPQGQALVRQFLRDLAVTHPKVLVVAAAGNDAGDAATFGPGGLDEPNLVTVGGLNHHGGRWKETWTDANGVQHTEGSNYMSSGGEVTLAAIAQDVYTGMDTNGDPHVASGTSFAAPQVTAAVAVLQALDPTLTAVEIKQILVDTAATEISDPAISDRIKDVDPALGGRVLRIDNAVWQVLQERLQVTGSADFDQVIGDATLNASARVTEDDPLTYKIVATAPGGGNTTTVQIAVNGPGGQIPGDTSLTTSDEKARWSWLFNDFGESAQVTLTRTDTGACARLVLSAGEASPYAGTYEASFNYLETEGWSARVTFTLTIDEQGTVASEGEDRSKFESADGTVRSQLAFHCGGSVGDDGNAACSGSVSLTVKVVGSDGVVALDETHEGEFTMSFTIGEDGTLDGSLSDLGGELHPTLEGHAVSGGPGG